jgi:uncharacterized membrane-anchored protein
MMATRAWVALGVFAVQLAAPGWLILRHELVLRQGEVFRFRAEPVDPADPFRGRFVAVQPRERSAPQAAGETLKHNERVCVALRMDAEGFARLATVSRRPPPGDAPHLRARVSYVQGTTVWLHLPLDRFYMEETLAPAAEAAYRATRPGGTNTAWLVVRVRKGAAVIEDVMVDGESLAVAARRHAERE